VKTAGVTTTKDGISTREVLLGLSSNQIVALDRRLLDPRRPLDKLTMQEMEDGLVQYHPVLYPPHDGYLTYNSTIPRLRKVATAPTRMESATLVAAWGLDFFVVQHHPSGPYDLLSEDFNYVLLILMTSALAVAVYFLKLVSQQAAVQVMWK
jgi:hypothetical protein